MASTSEFVSKAGWLTKQGVPRPSASASFWPNLAQPQAGGHSLRVCVPSWAGYDHG